MQFPALPEALRLARLAPPSGPVDIVLDTDTFNEIDDQFALVYALLSPERIRLEAVYAAPFHNARSGGPEDGMKKSYEEILRVLQRMGKPPQDFVWKGARRWMQSPEDGVPSEAVDDLIARARQEREGLLYVVCISAITNIASAIAIAPDIIERIVVVWLGGQPTYWHTTNEFNLSQDLIASRLIFDCGVPFVVVPCQNVAQHIKTTPAELERFVKGRGAIGDYLFEIFSDYSTDHFAWSKEIWDLAPLAWLVDPTWMPSALVHSPILTSENTWSHDPHRHLIREVRQVRRDAVFGDLFRKLDARL